MVPSNMMPQFALSLNELHNGGSSKKAIDVLRRKIYVNKVFQRGKRKKTKPDLKK